MTRINSRIIYYRNKKTGELADAHWIGTDEDGRPLFQYVEGWEPADYDGNPLECEQDYDCNWISPPSPSPR